MKSVYIHIPFCSNICSYCDFTKIYYNKKYINKYLDSLEKEINKYYNNEIVKTIYIGGGTPTSLDIDELNKLFKIIKVFKLDENVEFTIECNIENLTIEKLDLFKKNNVNRISIGIQTFNFKYLKLLNRNHNLKDVKKIINYAKKINFTNINIDLMYGFNGQTIKELDEDLNLFLSLNINHISTYSLMIEPHTKLYIENYKNIDEEMDYQMYEYICKKLKENDFIHYEVSNFAKKGYESLHNLTYWNNLEYYGFGLGASGFINKVRYTNTSNMNQYLLGNYIKEKEVITKKLDMEYEMILGLRKLKGVNILDFTKKFNIDLVKYFNIEKLIEENKLIIKDNYIYINPKYIYIENEFLISFIGE